MNLMLLAIANFCDTFLTFLALSLALSLSLSLSLSPAVPIHLPSTYVCFQLGALANWAGFHEVVYHAWSDDAHGPGP